MTRDELPFPRTPGDGIPVAEPAFLAIANRWRESFSTPHGESSQSEGSDQFSTACLLISVEAGSQLSKRASRMIAQCTRDVDRMPRTWPGDRLVWELCAAGMLKQPSRAIAVHNLIRMLDHPRSGIRARMLELGWIVRSWLGHPSAVCRLLTNLAYAHLYSDQAVVLARELCRGGPGLDEVVAGYPFYDDPSDKDPGRGFPAASSRAECLHSRYREITQNEIEAAEAELLKMECESRRAILATVWNLHQW